MGFFKKFTRQASKAIAKDIVDSMSWEEREKRRIEKEYGMKVASVKKFTSQAEYEEHERQERLKEERIENRLYDEGERLLNVAFQHHRDYVNGKISRNDFFYKMDMVLEMVSQNCVMAERIDPEGRIGPEIKFHIYNEVKRKIEHLPL